MVLVHIHIQVYPEQRLWFFLHKDDYIHIEFFGVFFGRVEGFMVHMSSCQIIIEGDKEDSVSLEDPNKRHLVAEVSTNVSVIQYVCLLHVCVVYVWVHLYC